MPKVHGSLPTRDGEQTPHKVHTANHGNEHAHNQRKRTHDGMATHGLHHTLIDEHTRQNSHEHTEERCRELESPSLALIPLKDPHERDHHQHDANAQNRA